MAKKTKKLPKASLVQMITLITGSVILLIAIIATLAYLVRSLGNEPDNFQSCKDAGGLILESYPEKCSINGKTFVAPNQSVEGGSDQSTNIDVTPYIGLNEQDALTKADEANRVARIVERDDEALAVTMDFSPGRLNIFVKDGKVFKVQVEGQE